jgi:hypothetical protein
MSFANYMGCLMERYKSLSLYYTKMCFKIRTQVSLSPEQSTLAAKLAAKLRNFLLGCAQIILDMTHEGTYRCAYRWLQEKKPLKPLMQ